MDRELVNATLGRSIFSPERLARVISDNEAQLAQVKKDIYECETGQADTGKKLKRLSQEVQQIKTWAAEFDNFTTDEKKMILAHMIEKITCNRNYEITIFFYIAMEDFQEAIAQSMANGYNVIIQEGKLPKAILA